MRLIAIMVGMGLLMTSLMLIPAPAAAEITYFYTAAPTAYNGTTWTVYPRYSTSAVDTDSVKAFNDESYHTVYTSTSGIYKWAKTNDFTNTGDWYVDTEGDPFWTTVSHMPPDDATIEQVYVVIVFEAYRPDTTLYFSTDDDYSYNNSGVLSGSMSPYYGTRLWDVTALADWTPALLNSTDVWLKAKMTPTLGVNYYLDYLGFEVFWSGDYVGGGGGEDWVPGEEDLPGPPPLDYSIIYDAEGIIGIMGFVGLIGMVATPAIMVYANRQNQGDGKMNLFIKGLVMFMFFLTFFMVSLGI